MGLSAFWTAIKRPRFNEPQSRKHVETIYDQHHKASPTGDAGNDPAHHFDAIYDTHHHILPTQNSGPKRHPSSPPRIHSPTSKQNKRQSLWKSPSLSLKPNQAQDVRRTKSEKRRSFWRPESKPTTSAPPVREPEVISIVSEDKKAKRRSFWRSGPEDVHLLSDDAPANELKTKRSSRRLSLRRSVSGKSSRSRLSWLAGGAEDTDDEDIPALPPIPVDIQRQISRSRSKDPGRQLGVGNISVIQPGTAITSDDTHYTAAEAPQVSRNSVKRQSLTRLITNRKSTGNMSQDQSGQKRKRRSWFSVHGSDQSSPDTAIPPVPALPGAIPKAPIDPSEAAFHRFLHNIHNARPQGAATDYERFMDASRVYDASIPILPTLSHRNSSSTLHAPRPRPVSSAAPTALPTLKRATYSAPRTRASRCRPQKTEEPEVKEPESPSSRGFLSNEQQREWNKLRELLDDSPANVSASDDGFELEDDDGVMGMLRQLKRDEDEEARITYEKKLRDRQRGYGAWANEDALAALEFGGR